MSDDRKSIENIESKSSDNRPQMPSNVQTEVDAGIKDHTQTVKDYTEARKQGLRDKDTAEHLGSQPEFFDSALARHKQDVPELKGLTGTNEKGLVTSVMRADDGKTVDIEYDKFDHPTKLTLPDGDEWRKNDDANHWTRYDKDGKAVDELKDGDITVSKNGDITMHDYIKRREDTSHPDGSHTVGFMNGRSYDTDSEGHVTGITAVEYKYVHTDGVAPDWHAGTVRVPNEVKYTPEYDQDGSLNKLKRSDGSEWRKGDDGWTHVSESGKEIEKFDGAIAISDEGDIAKIGNDGNTDITHSSGERTTLWKYGGQTTYDTEDKKIQSVDPNGSIHEFSDGGYDTRDGRREQRYRDPQGREFSLHSPTGLWKDIGWKQVDKKDERLGKFRDEGHRLDR